MAYSAPSPSSTPQQIVQGVTPINGRLYATGGAAPAAPAAPSAGPILASPGSFVAIQPGGSSTGPIGNVDPLTTQSSGLPGFGGVGVQTPSGVSVLTAALLPSDSALALMGKWLLAWGVFFFVLFMLDRTRIGHALMYYALTLAVVFTALVEWRWFATVLEPITGVAPGGTPVTADNIGATVGQAVANAGTGGGPTDDGQSNQSTASASSAQPASALAGTGLEDTTDIAALTVQPF